MLSLRELTHPFGFFCFVFSSINIQIHNFLLVFFTWDFEFFLFFVQSRFEANAFVGLYMHTLVDILGRYIPNYIRTWDLLIRLFRKRYWDCSNQLHYYPRHSMITVGKSIISTINSEQSELSMTKCTKVCTYNKVWTNFQRKSDN